MKCFTHGGVSDTICQTIMKHSTRCFCSSDLMWSCCVYIRITRAFLQEDDLGLWEEVGAGDDHLFPSADEAAG